MHARQPQARHRRRAAGLTATAVAAIALASCGGGGHAGTVASRGSRATAAATAAVSAAATGRPAAGATGGAPPPTGSGSASADPAGSPAIAAVANPVHPALGRIAASGGPLTLVVDEPTGPFGQQNELIRQGAIAALDILNARGGVAHQAVRLVSEPLDGLSPGAVQQRLHRAGSNAVLVLPCDANSQTSLAVGASAYGTLMLAPCDADASLAQRLRTYWPIGMSGSDEAAGLVHYMSKEGFGRVFVVNATGSNFASTMTGYVLAALRAAGTSIVGSVTVPASLGSADVRRVVGAVHAANPASLFTALPPPQFDQLAAGLWSGGERQVYLFGTSPLDTPLTLASPGSSALNGATFPTYGFARINAEAMAFERDYQQRFGRRPVGAFPGLGFETVGLLEAAIAKARSTQTAALQQALLGGLNDGGVALFPRAYNNPSNHNPATTVSVEKVTAGSFLPLLTTEPNGSPPPPLP